MGTVSYEYLAHAMARLSGIPVRIYESSEERCRFFPAALPKDPLELCREEVLAIREHVGYFATPLFHYYGVLNSGNVKIVIGPTAQIMGDEQQLRELAFRLDVPAEQVSVFTEGMNAIMRLPVETLLQMLCTLNHFLNGGEMLTLSDIAIHEAEQMQIKTGLPWPLKKR